MRNKSFCIAIDGPSSSGKSTVAKGVAKKLGFFHIDSGAIYRALAWWMEKHEMASLGAFDYRVEERGGECFHFVGDVDVTQEIRAPCVSQAASKIAVEPLVRKRVNEIQREIAKGRAVVIEGRDIGSVVFPNAQVKVFLTASLEERVKRRFHEWMEKGAQVTIEEVRNELLERDERDRLRKEAPLIQVKDAYVVDTTGCSPEEVIGKIVAVVRLKQKKSFSFLYRGVTGAFWCFFRLFYRIELHGIENYLEGALIIAPNHASFFDPPVMGAVCPGEIHSLGHVYLFKNAFFKWLFPRVNVHPVASDAGDLNTLKKVVELLSNGEKVLIFPEGTRSSDNKLAPLKRGIAMMASMASCKVLPVWISGAYEVWPRSKKFPKLWGKIIVTFGIPLDWKNYEKRGGNKKEAQAIFVKDLEEAINALGGKDHLS